jgi:hypothetical protein
LQLDVDRLALLPSHFRLNEVEAEHSVQYIEEKLRLPRFHRYDFTGVGALDRVRGEVSNHTHSIKVVGEP